MRSQPEKVFSRFRTVPEAERFFVFYLLRSPEEACPLFEYCVIEAAYTLSVDWVFDLQRREVLKLLAQPGIQRELGLIYERPPKDWRNIRAEPLLVTRLLENMIASWPPILPLRVLLLYDRQDQWWVEAAAERFRVSRTKARIERITWQECLPPHCPLLRQGESHSSRAEISPSEPSADENEGFALMIRPSSALCLASLIAALPRRP